ncbi:DMT family transporter [Orrella sp. JC864]|uniref:DMT family transporter n=1 Tax=Orrella sp. JC864 TaxID=3120298 RepID=UPI0012BBB67D
MPAAPAVRPQYFLLPLGSVLMWSGNMVVTKMSASVISPVTIGFYRWLIAGLALTPFLAYGVWRERHRIRPHLGKLAVLGALGMAVYQGLMYFAAAHTSATNMAFITSLVPLLTIAVSAALMQESPPRLAVLGGLLSLAGISVLVSHGRPAMLLEAGVNRGDVLIFLAALGYAVYGVLVRKWAIPLSAWHSLYVQIGFGLLVQLPAFLYLPATPLDAANLPLVLYAALLPSIFAPYLWLRAIDVLGASRASIFVNLTPVFTIVIAALLLAEPVESYHLAGGAIVLTGVMLAQWRPGARRPARGA